MMSVHFFTQKVFGSFYVPHTLSLVRQVLSQRTSQSSQIRKAELGLFKDTNESSPSNQVPWLGHYQLQTINGELIGTVSNGVMY